MAFVAEGNFGPGNDLVMDFEGLNEGLRAVVEGDTEAIRRLIDGPPGELEKAAAEYVEFVPDFDRTVPQVVLRSFSHELLKQLQIDPTAIHKLSPGQFEDLIANRLEDMGYVPTLIGNVNSNDGGIDIIAVPKKPESFGHLIAVQCEHHREGEKTGVGKLDDLLRWNGSEFQIGLMVTNTTFTKDARFVAKRPNNASFLRLREFEDVSQWIQGNYNARHDWSDLPKKIELRPGYWVDIPRPQ